ncbi:hypothetical protein PPYC1_24485 [Paenibacillus polymyxa]|nr:hypothetical protein PPYC1_24485 [Paenibacillus polymyxa]
MDKQAKLHLMGRIDDKLTELPYRKLVEKYATASGKPALTVHSLRHSCACCAVMRFSSDMFTKPVF